jgi:hypothetical protein
MAMIREAFMGTCISDKKIHSYLELIEFTERHPHLSKLALNLISDTPVLKGFLPASTRIYMGGRILDSYRVDLAAGQISFAAVDKQIVGSEFVEILCRELKESLGEKEGQQAMYDLHYRAMEEQLAEMDFQSVFPDFCASLFGAPADPELLGSSPSLARLYEEMESMLIRLLFNESGWGSPLFNSMPVPSKVTVHNSAEVEWTSSSDEPVCYGLAGHLAALVSFVAGESYLAREIQCAATGAPDCVFTVEKE